MKNAILILAIMLTTCSVFAQADSTQKKINFLIESNRKVQNDIQNIQVNLLQCHRVYKAGLCLSAIGIGMTAIGVYYANETPLYSGGVLTLLGCGTVIYSHSYIQKAGIGFGSNGLALVYAF